MTWLLPLVAILGLFVGYIAQRLTTARKLGDTETRAQRILDDAKRLVDQATRESEAKVRDAETKVRAGELEAKELVLKVRAELDLEARGRQKEMHEVERRILHQEEQLARRLDQLDRRETDTQTRERVLGDRERIIGEKETRLATAVEEQRRKLEGIAGLTAEEAKRQLLAQMEAEARREAQLLGMRLDEEARETAHAKAKEVLATTIQRLAPDYTVETAVSIVDCPRTT
jgi:ribonuclease Y